MARRGSSGINALVAIDKPEGMTSHDVVSAVRRAVGERRVGHAGTLDPAATGVLVVGIGQATRLLGLLCAERKRYLALIEFGRETTTDDAEGDVTREAAAPAWAADEARAREALRALEGPCLQVPPAYSAISVGGVRAYARARAGEQPELEARPVEIYGAQLVSIKQEEGALSWVCSFEVSKGCYIRAIARDLGRSLGSAAHLAALRRSSSGTVGLGSCLALAELEDKGAGIVVERALDPLRVLGLAACELTEQEARVAAGGKAPALARARTARLAENQAVALVFSGRLVGIWRWRAGRLSPEVNLPLGIVGVRP